jgi:hypothetical protein
MHTISNRFLRLAVVAALCGMAWGAFMGARQDFALATAHAHLNLLGWVSMTLYGLFYRVVPNAAEGLLPRLHFWVALAGVVIFVPSLALVLHSGPYLAIAEKTIMLATLLIVVSMILFATIVFKNTSKASA